MSVPLYLDHHVPEGVRDGLRDRGVDVVTAYADARADAEDEAVLERATQLGRLLYSQDKDFLRIASQWMKDGREFAGLAYAHQLSITIGEAVHDLELIAKACDPSDVSNRVQFLPFRSPA